MACEPDFNLCHIHIEQGFVQSELEESAYTLFPGGCGMLSMKTVRLNKSLHGGLQQASKQ